MKITLYTPDGTAETFRDCELTDETKPDGLLAFRGTNYMDKRVGIITPLPFRIVLEASEVFELSPLVQDNVPTERVQ